MIFTNYLIYILLLLLLLLLLFVSKQLKKGNINKINSSEQCIAPPLLPVRKSTKIPQAVTSPHCKPRFCGKAKNRFNGDSMGNTQIFVL
jgi:hypothetical protein